MNVLGAGRYFAALIAAWLVPGGRSAAYVVEVRGVAQYRSAFERLWDLDVRKWNGKKVKAVLNPEAGNNGYVRVDVAGRTVGFLPDHVAKKYTASRTRKGRAEDESRYYRPIPDISFFTSICRQKNSQRATQAGYAPLARHARTSHKFARTESAEGMI